MFSTCFKSNRFSNRQTTTPLNFVDCYQRFHHVYTASILLILSLIILLREWSFDSIDCSLLPQQQQQQQESIVNPEEFSAFHYNNYCKLHGRFILPGKNISSFIEICTNHSSLWNKQQQEFIDDNPELPQYKYFGFILAIFALLLQLPNQLWKCFAYNAFMLTFKNHVNIDDFGEQINQQIQMTMKKSMNSCLLIIVLWFVRMMNVSLICLLICILQSLTKGNFIFLPVIVGMKIYPSNRNDIECQYNFDPFPKSTLCQYRYYDYKHFNEKIMFINCLMPINSLLEQIMLFIWIWLLIMIIITIFYLNHHFLLTICNCWRRIILKQQSNYQLNEQTLRLGSKSYRNFIMITLIWIQNATTIIQNKPTIELPLIESNRRTILTETSNNV